MVVLLLAPRYAMRAHTIVFRSPADQSPQPQPMSSIVRPASTAVLPADMIELVALRLLQLWPASSVYAQE